MIHEKIMYGVTCDNCGAEWMDEDNGFVAFTDKCSISESLSEDYEWHTERDKHYCPDCFRGFDDDDNLILKSLTTKQQP